ncbi:MAG: C1 family peptidase [Rikenellaceae bacterium]
MKKIILVAFAISMMFSAVAQENVKVGPYKLKKICDNVTTSVKDQNRTGTCWAWSTLATLESDIIKNGKADKTLELSTMWVARNAYFEKFVKYVRMQGNVIFDEGGAAHDVPFIIAKYGIVPQKDYKALEYGEKNHVHAEMLAVLKSYADVLIKNPNGKLTTVWQDAVNNILDAYFGKRPSTITVDSVEYTPLEYAAHLGITDTKYVAFASSTAYPYGEMFVYEVPDNWNWGEFMNVPLKEFTQIAIDAVKNGYTIAWGTDVSDLGFKFRDGFAVYPDVEKENVAGMERAKWEKMNSVDKNKALFSKVVKEKVVTPEYRQELFDNYTATDDHGMQIVGLYKAADGSLFFKVKNSWTENSAAKGFFYVSMPFFEALTMNYMLNVEALNADVKAKYLK